MITRRQIRAKVMQAIYAQMSSDDDPKIVFKALLGEAEEQLKEVESQKELTGDTQLLHDLYFESVKNSDRYDEYIIQKAANWELDRIARVDRILMQMGICEMLNFDEIPIKVTINEYLELAKQFSTPKSSKFINGILDSLHNDFKREGKIIKRGRGLIDHTASKK